VATKYRALLIGNSVYLADEHNLQTLKGPAKDIAALNRALVDTETGLFDDLDITLLPEATSIRALRAIGTFFGSARRDDVLLLYFSGHGKLDQLGRLHLCMQDTDSTDLLATAVSSTRINEFAETSRARTLVIVLDCCHAGAFRGGEFGDSLVGPGRYVMTSCRGTQLANDASAENGTSYFTQHLVEGLVGAASDRDNDGYVDFSDLYDYVDRRLRDERKQIPQRKVSGDGDVPLARRPAQSLVAPVSAPPIPAHQPNLTRSPRLAAEHRRIPAFGPAKAAATVAGVIGAAGIITLVVLLNGSAVSGNNSHVNRTPVIVDRRYVAASPWRLKIQDVGSVTGDPGCTIEVRSATGTSLGLVEGIYDSATFQVALTGTLTLLKNEPGCQLAPLAGSGSLPLPATVANSRGDTDAFPVPGTLSVTGRAFTGGDCRVTLRDAADGTVVNFAALTPAVPDADFGTGTTHAAYLQHSGCAVAISTRR
jgi:hypothetical protein